MITILTHIQIDNNDNYVITGSFEPVDAFRIIRKQNYEPIKDTIENYCSNFAKENKTQIILKTYQCKTV
jgi:hypothetical protein